MELQTMMTDLRKTFSELELADRLGINQSSVNRIANGKMMPKWTLGKRIEDLHRSVVVERETA